MNKQLVRIKTLKHAEIDCIASVNSTLNRFLCHYYGKTFLADVVSHNGRYYYQVKVQVYSVPSSIQLMLEPELVELVDTELSKELYSDSKNIRE